MFLAMWCLLAASAPAQDLSARTAHYQDLPAAIARRFDAKTFATRIHAIDLDTKRRERDGEFDHLIYYALQSRFTDLPPIEPALSAKELTESGAIPQAARARLTAFLEAVAHPASDQRLRYFESLLKTSQRTPEFLEAEYRRAMRFLYDKEFLKRPGVYQTRGHSTDSQVEANYAVWKGLSVLKRLAPETRISRVLIVGPGVEFAPRTALFDRFAPQSSQPYAIADALLSLGLARRGQLRIDCADINARVLDFIQSFPQSTRQLEVYSQSDDAEYRQYFSALGSAIGQAETPNPLAKTLRVDAEVARAIRAAKLNILTERWPASYDLAVATNVLLYFNSDELALALANIAAMLPAGSYFLHNEVRPELDELAAAAGLEPVQARTLRVAKGRLAPLFDAFAIYRKTAAQ